MLFDIIMIMFGIYLVVLGLAIVTDRFIVSLIFKIIPFFAGLYAIIYAIMNMGIIQINF